MATQSAFETQIQAEQQAYLQEVEAEMARFFTQQREMLSNISPDALSLLAAIEALSTGGKRLRALLSYWGWRGAGGVSILEDPKPLSVVRIGVAIELFQSAALIHDDIIDRSDTRRGAPAVHKRFENQHKSSAWRGDTFNYGLTGGIIAGDLCLSWSETRFARTGVGSLPDRTARTVFDTMRTEVMAGQYLDVLSEVIDSEDYDAALQRAQNVIRYKSAKYSCEHPLTLGGALALDAQQNQHHPILNAYRSFGLPLGEGFQLRDDQLGVFGEPETTGKPAGDDIREGKRTVLVALTEKNADQAGRSLLETCLGNPNLDVHDVQRVRGLMLSCGAVAQLEELIARKSAAIDTALAALPVPEQVREALEAIAAKALHRAA